MSKYPYQLSTLRPVRRSSPTSRRHAAAAHAARASRAVGRKAKLEESSYG
jgi:hypothetical protein